MWIDAESPTQVIYVNYQIKDQDLFDKAFGASVKRFESWEALGGAGFLLRDISRSVAYCGIQKGVSH